MATVVNDYFLIPPDWESSISLKRKWETSIQSSLNKKEKRSAILTWPKRTMAFFIGAMSYSDTAYIKRKMFKFLDNIYGIPLWMNECILTSSVSIGVDTFLVDSTDYKDIEIGGEIVLMYSKDVYEILVVDSFTSSSITTTTNSLKPWTANATGIFPILKARLSETQSMGNSTSRYSDITIEATEEFDDITRNVPEISSFPVHMDYPIFNTPPEWSNELTTEFSHDIDILRFFGPSVTLTHQDETEMKFKSDFLFGEKEDVQKLTDFFDYHKGRWGSFWRPSWMEDLKITSPISSSDQSIIIEDIEFSDYWENNNAGKWIMIIWPDNSYYIGGITGVLGTEISLNAAIGKDVSSGELNGLLVCFLHISRFTQDELEVVYQTDSISNIRMSFTTILNEVDYPEVI